MNSSANVSALVMPVESIGSMLVKWLGLYTLAPGESDLSEILLLESSISVFWQLLNSFTLTAPMGVLALYVATSVSGFGSELVRGKVHAKLPPPPWGAWDLVNGAFLFISRRRAFTPYVVCACYFVASAWLASMSNKGYYPGVIRLVRTGLTMALGWVVSGMPMAITLALFGLYEHGSAALAELRRCRQYCSASTSALFLHLWELNFRRLSVVHADPGESTISSEPHSQLAEQWIERPELDGLVVAVKVTKVGNRVTYEPIAFGFGAHGCLGFPGHFLSGKYSLAHYMSIPDTEIYFAKATNELHASLKGCWKLDSTSAEAYLKGCGEVVRVKHFTAGEHGVSVRDLGYLRCHNAGSFFGTFKAKNLDPSYGGMNHRVCRYIRDPSSGKWLLRWASTDIAASTSAKGLMTSTAGSEPGMSGAPVVNAMGQVCGMNLGDHMDTTGDNRVAMAMTAQQLKVSSRACGVKLGRTFMWVDVPTAEPHTKWKVFRSAGSHSDAVNMSDKVADADQEFDPDFVSGKWYDDYEYRRVLTQYAEDYDREEVHGEGGNSWARYGMSARQRRNVSDAMDHFLDQDSDEHSGELTIKDLMEELRQVRRQLEALPRMEAELAALKLVKVGESHSRVETAPLLMEAAKERECLDVAAFSAAIQSGEFSMAETLTEEHSGPLLGRPAVSMAPAAPVVPIKPAAPVAPSPKAASKKKRSNKRAQHASPLAPPPAFNTHAKPVKVDLRKLENRPSGEAEKRLWRELDRVEAPPSEPRRVPDTERKVRHIVASCHTKAFEVAGVAVAEPKNLATAECFTGRCAVCCSPTVADSCFCAVHKVVQTVMVDTNMPALPEGDFLALKEKIQSKCPNIVENLKLGSITRLPEDEATEDFCVQGEPFLLHVASTRHKSGAMGQKPREMDQRFVDCAVEAGFSRAGVADYVWPDRTAAGVRSSIAANLEKRKPHNQPLPLKLAAFIQETVVNPSLPRDSWSVDLASALTEWRSYFQDLPADDVSAEKLFLSVFPKRVAEAVESVKPDKSSGWSQFTTGETLKRGILNDEAKREFITSVATERLYLYVTDPRVAHCSADQMIQLGLRDPVVPSVKGEMHPSRKVFKRNTSKAYVLDANGKRVRLANPRWRTIYSQSMADEIVGRVLEKPHNVRQQGLYKSGAGVWTGIGTGSDDRNIVLTKARVLAAMNADTTCLVVSDDVSGMDWCGSGWSAAIDVTSRLATAHSCWPEAVTNNQKALKAMIAQGLLAYGCTLARSTYLVGQELWAQATQGVNDSGVLSTGFKNSHARAFLAWLAGARGATACGDDCAAVFDRPEDPQKFCDSLTDDAAKFGFEIRDQTCTNYGDAGFECCSKVYGWTADPSYNFLNLDKAVAKVCAAQKLADDTFEGLCRELRHDVDNLTKWRKFREVVVAKGLAEKEDREPVDPFDDNFS